MLAPYIYDILKRNLSEGAIIDRELFSLVEQIYCVLEDKFHFTLDDGNYNTKASLLAIYKLARNKAIKDEMDNGFQDVNFNVRSSAPSAGNSKEEQAAAEPVILGEDSSGASIVGCQRAPTSATDITPFFNLVKEFSAGRAAHVNTTAGPAAAATTASKKLAAPVA